MGVRYKGDKYKCKLLDKFTITIIKVKLWLKRCLRLFKIVFPKNDLLLYFMIICIWLIFAYVSNFIDFRKSQVQESFLRTLWGMKNSIFSSVIIAFAIGAFNHVKEYREIIKRQHYIYVDTMEAFEEIIRTLDNTQIWYHFHPLYNEQCLRESICYLRNNDYQINTNDKDFIISLDTVQERISLVEQELKMGHLLVKDEEMMILYLALSKKKLSKVILNRGKDEFEEFLRYLLGIVDQMRYVWRKDEKDDSRIISILCKDNSEDIRNDFYKRMFLPDFELGMLVEYL